jgi:hypothetical protein
MRHGLLLLFAVFVGCSPLGSAVRAYDHGLYPDALASLAALEGRAESLGPGDRARYALYRGLAHLSVGDAGRATPWLYRAKQAADDDPTLLSDEDMGRLGSALSHVPFGPVVRPLLDLSADP